MPTPSGRRPCLTPARPRASERPPTLPPAPSPGEMSLVDHLVELRNRLVKVVLAVAVGVGRRVPASATRSSAILKAPIPGGKPLYYTGLGDAFVINVKIAIVVGIILAMPVILYQVWAFVAPGPDGGASAGSSVPWIPLALVFFALGVGIAYVILPFAAGFLLGFSDDGPPAADHRRRLLRLRDHACSSPSA